VQHASVDFEILFVVLNFPHLKQLRYCQDIRPYSHALTNYSSEAQIFTLSDYESIHGISSFTKTVLRLRAVAKTKSKPCCDYSAVKTEKQ